MKIEEEYFLSPIRNLIFRFMKEIFLGKKKLFKMDEILKVKQFIYFKCHTPNK